MHVGSLFALFSRRVRVARERRLVMCSSANTGDKLAIPCQFPKARVDCPASLAMDFPLQARVQTVSS
jgi:hypothetical protein